MAYFQNRQWAVTEWGLEANPGRVSEYLIPASQLLVANGIGGGKYYDWPLQLAAKTWIDIGAFNEAGWLLSTIGESTAGRWTRRCSRRVFATPLSKQGVQLGSESRAFTPAGSRCLRQVRGDFVGWFR